MAFEQKLIRPQIGGMVTSRPARMLQDGEFQLLENLIFKDGLYHKRPGLEPLNGSNGDTGGLSSFPLLLARYYHSGGDKYSVCIDLADPYGTSTYCRLLIKKNDKIPPASPTPVVWTVVDATLFNYLSGGKPTFFNSISFFDKLIFTDGQNNMHYFEEQNDADECVHGRLGALPPLRQPSSTESEWSGNPIIPGGFAQYCCVLAYEDESGQVTYSNPSPRSDIHALDWMGKWQDGYKKLPLDPEEEDLQFYEGHVDVGPTKIYVEDLSVGTEFMVDASDTDATKRIIRRDIYRRTKQFADLGFGPWEKVGEEHIKDGEGGSGFVDQVKDPSRKPLDTDNYPPPRMKYLTEHKGRVVGMNYVEDVIEAPPNQGDTAYPYYDSFGLLKRARIAITNNTDQGFTDAVVRIRLVWGSGRVADGDYIDFVETGNDPEHNILFTDLDGKTLLKFYRESYKRSGWITYENPTVADFEVGERITGGGATARIRQLDLANDKIYIENMSSHAFAEPDSIEGGTSGGEADITAVDFSEAIFIVKVPEIISGSSAFIYVYYNVAVGGSSIDDPGSTFDKVYHRKYASSDMKILYNMNLDYPMKSMVNVRVEKLSLTVLKCMGAGTSPTTAPYGNDLGSKAGEYSLSMANSNHSRAETSLSCDEGNSQGTYDFWIRRRHNDGELVRNYMLVYGGGFNIYCQDNGSDLTVDFMNGDELLLSIPTGVTLSLDEWYFIRVSWGSGTAHIYVREAGLSDYSGVAVDISVGLQEIDPQCNVRFGFGVDVHSVDIIGRQGYYDELVYYKRCLTLEQTEQAFYRRDLDAFFYDVAGGRDEAAWNSASATCSIKTFNSDDVGDDGTARPAGIVMSDNKNPNIFSHKNRRTEIGGGGESGSGVIGFQGHLLAYKEHSVYRIRTDGTVAQWMEEDVPFDEAKKIGCVAPRTLKLANIKGSEVVIALDDTGLHAFDGSNFIELSQPIANILRDDYTAEQRKWAIGEYWAKYGVYILTIGKTARTAFGAKLDETDLGLYVSDTAYVFHLDTFNYVQRENIERIVDIKITKWTAGGVMTVASGGSSFTLGEKITGAAGDTAIIHKIVSDTEIHVMDASGGFSPTENITGSLSTSIASLTAFAIKNRFSFGYPCIWGSGDHDDNGEFLFGAADDNWIYVLGSRTGDDVYKDDWDNTDRAIPVQLRSRRFWYRSAIFRSYIAYYIANKMNGSMAEVINVLNAQAKSYDRVDNEITTHLMEGDIKSGGNRGQPDLLPDTAVGEWLEFLFSEMISDGDFVWEGMMYEVNEIVSP